MAQEFTERISEAEKIDGVSNGHTSAAHGMSAFIPAIDISFSDVFNRADQEIYKNKTRMKKSQKSHERRSPQKNNGGGYLFGRNNLS